ncbi:MAG: lipopolysaccharide biosynthesis protein [Planctomycetota bacterium]
MSSSSQAVKAVFDGRRHEQKSRFLTLFSQALVSGTNFVTSVIVGNACGADGLGYYALGFSIVVFGIGLQSAVVSIPYTVFYPAESESRRKLRAGSSLWNHGRVLVLGSVLLLLASVILFSTGAAQEAMVGACLLMAVPATISRDFARRICFADVDSGKAIKLDSSVTAIQLGLLSALWLADLLTPEAAILSVGLACLIPSIVFFHAHKARFEFDRESLRKDAEKDWQFGKWILVEQVFTIASTYLMPWLLAIYLDSVAVGVFAACFSIAGLSNPFLQGMGNFLLPVFSRHVSNGNRQRLSRDNRRYTVMTAGVMLAFFAVCAVAGEWMLATLFPRKDYDGFGSLVALLAARSLIGSFGLTAHYVLLAVEKPRVSLVASVLSVISMVIAAVFLIPEYGLYGAGISWLLGTFVESAVMIIGYLNFCSYRQDVK